MAARRVAGGPLIAPGRLGRVRWLVPAAGALALLDGVLRPPAAARPVDRVSFAALLALLTWFGWLVAQTGFAADPEELRVTNFGRVHHIPWSDIESVREDREVVVMLRSGRAVRLLGGGGSLLGVMVGRHGRRDLVEEVDRQRAAADPSARESRHGWRLHLVPAVTAIALLAAVAWLHG